MGILGIFQDGKKVSKIVFPITRPGESSTIKVTVKNEAMNYCQILGVRTPEAKVKIESYPKGLEPKREEVMTLTWSPDKTLLDPLRTTIEFDEVIG